MTKQQIIEQIAKETLNLITESRIDQITLYIELWENYKGELDKNI